MGKAKRLKIEKSGRNVALEEQLENNKRLKPSTRGVKKSKKEFVDEERFIDGALSSKILKAARKQQEELEDELGTGSNVTKKKEIHPVYKKIELGARQLGDDDDDDSDAWEDEAEDEGKDDFYDDIKIDEEDEKALATFMSAEPQAQRTLADFIADKLKEKQTEIRTQFSDAGSMKVQDLDEKVVDLYKGVKCVLARYRSGKIPKAFKIIPALANWEQILDITCPDTWTSSAIFAATRLFTSNLKESMAQRFFNLILLPRVRDDIAEYKRLNFHLYQALRKALFKPGAFFKGIVLPMCESGDCSLREAVIVSSVVNKAHIPILHGCAAILKIAEMEYTGANSVFLNNLINKRFALPYRVIDALVHHFLRFEREERTLPVLWHQCLLVFVQHYKSDISSEQKDALLELLKAQFHHQITPVIRKELITSLSRDNEATESGDEEEDGGTGSEMS